MNALLDDDILLSLAVLIILLFARRFIVAVQGSVFVELINHLVISYCYIVSLFLHLTK